MRATVALCAGWAWIAVVGSATAFAAEAATAPKVVRLDVFPATLTLSDLRDARRVLVTGRTAGGEAVDLSAAAKLTAVGPQVRVDEDGFVTPVAVGETQVVVQAGGQEARIPVRVAGIDAKPMSFTRDILPVTTKVGCNAGTCHGSQKGQAGFKLSLRGYDPLYDYRALVDDLSGRRFNRAQPSQSLMLLKPTQGVPHEGGFLFDEDSRFYATIAQWIAEGCKYDSPARVARIEVFPEKPLLPKSGDRQQQLVIAHFADGTSRDVTREAIFEISDFEVATVSAGGEIEAVRRGEAAVLVRYEGAYAANPVTVVGQREGFVWNDSPAWNFIDEHVDAKLRRLKIVPSELCTDAEFLRRISLDLTGVPPTADEVRAFVADPRDARAKRDAKIDELLAGPGYVDHSALKWSDLLMSNRKFITEKGVWAFRHWIRHALATNKPYDDFVRELLTANGNAYENPAANYYRIGRDPKIVMENMTQVFIGTRFMCGQCHDHPFERWTQTNYYELSAFFAGVGRKPGESKDEEIVYSLTAATPVVHAGTGQAVAAAFPYGAIDVDRAQGDLRPTLADWLTRPENPYFATSLVNRYWSYFTGRGIIDPVDDIRSSNPPSNPELLSALTKDFTEHGFDLKRLVRLIVTSHTYQRSFRANEFNKDDAINYSHALPRRLSAEQLFDSVMVATGAPLRIPGVPAGYRATQLPDSQVQLGFLDMFGRPPRESPCECERTSEVSLKQTLNLINGPTISDAIIDPQGLIARVIAAKKSDREIAEDVYLSVLCRLPSEDERIAAEKYLADVGNKSEAAQDPMWALINSSAFLFNR